MTIHDPQMLGSPLGAVAEVDGQAINVRNPDDAIARVMARLRAQRGFTFATLNLDHLVKLRSNPAFRAAYRRMTLVSADGAPVAALARSQFAQMQRATGADLLRPLCEAAAREKMPVAFFGSTEESLAKAAAKLRERDSRFVGRADGEPAFRFRSVLGGSGGLRRPDRRQRRAAVLHLSRRAKTGGFRRPAGARARDDRLHRRGRGAGFHRRNPESRAARRAAHWPGMGLAAGLPASSDGLALCAMRGHAGANHDRETAVFGSSRPWFSCARARRMTVCSIGTLQKSPSGGAAAKSVLTLGSKFVHRPHDRHRGKPCGSCVAPFSRPHF